MKLRSIQVFEVLASERKAGMDSTYEALLVKPRLHKVKTIAVEGYQYVSVLGIEPATGQFVCQRDDDRWPPPNVEKQVRWFEELVEECGVVYRNDEEVGWY